MNTDDMIAQFLAKGGKIAKVEMGLRATTDSQIRRLTGPEPEKLVKYEAFLIGEDGMEFAVTVKAKNRKAAIDKIKDDYPESQLVSIDHFGQRDKALYDEAFDEAHEIDQYYPEG